MNARGARAAYRESVRLADEETRDRFAAARVARLATAGGDGTPHIVPVTFAVAGPTIVCAIDHKPKSHQPTSHQPMSTVAGLRRLRNIAENPRVSLLVDHYDDEWSRLWWARADGRARIVAAGRSEHDAAVRLLIARYDQYRTVPPAGPAIIVTVTRWSGWAFTA